ncbi:hypothetical protein Misp05_01560 [Micromonospora sp. NBRC 107095]|nr:hypothetical protein Misp05_01560 [Micromonospora sp. NBRC 107095]
MPAFSRNHLHQLLTRMEGPLAGSVHDETFLYPGLDGPNLRTVSSLVYMVSFFLVPVAAAMYMFVRLFLAEYSSIENWIALAVALILFVLGGWTLSQSLSRSE